MFSSENELPGSMRPRSMPSGDMSGSISPEAVSALLKRLDEKPEFSVSVPDIEAIPAPGSSFMQELFDELALSDLPRGAKSKIIVVFTDGDKTTS